MADNRNQPLSRVHAALPHDSAPLHVAGSAIYADDAAEPANMLHLAFGKAKHAHAKILAMKLDAVRAAPGVVAVFSRLTLTRRFRSMEAPVRAPTVGGQGISDST